MKDLTDQLYQFLLSDLHSAVMAFADTLLQLAFVIIVLGIGWSALKHRFRHDTGDLLWAVAAAGIIAGLIAVWPALAEPLGNFHRIVEGLSGQIRQNVMGAYSGALAAFEKGSLRWSLLVDPVDCITGVIVYFMSWAGFIVMSCAKLLQFFLIELSLAFSSVFLSLFAFQATRSIGVNFVSGSIGLFLWPLTWNFVDLALMPMAKYAAAQAAAPMVMLNTMGCLAACTLLGYILAPFWLTHKLKTGGDPGSALVGASVGLTAALAAFAAKIGLSLALGNPVPAVEGAASLGKETKDGGGKEPPPPSSGGGSDPLPPVDPAPVPLAPVSSGGSSSGGGAAVSYPGGVSSGNKASVSVPMADLVEPPPLPAVVKMTPPEGVALTPTFTPHPNTLIGQTIN
ncbi:MAG: hypothetical protein LBH01_03955 [Verrucomicrobiales bacterium]|jgi:hypothetical protein|nr:hypothetical protein [Verrucomicrobiales bacterium]